LVAGPSPVKLQRFKVTRLRPLFTNTEAFTCNGEAVVTVDGQQIIPDIRTSGDTVDMIPAYPVAASVARLLYRIGAGGEFCVHSGPSPSAAVSDGTFVQCETSGSTGRSKRIRRSHASWIRSFEVDRDLWAIQAQDCIATFGPLNHSIALYGVISALHLGTSVAVIAAQRPDVRRRLLHKTQPTFLYTTPAQIRQLAVADDATTPVRSLRHILVGGGFLDDSARRAAVQLFPEAEVHAFYGASETSFITIADAGTPPLSVGRAYPGVQIDIRDRDGLALPAGQCGDVWVRSPYLFDRYVKGNSTQTRWHGDSLTVGELGWLDPTGYLFLAGRHDRMFTVADRNVYPEMIERFLLDLPGVAQAAVLPTTDNLRGAVPVCYVRPQGDPLDIEAMLTACRRAFGPQAAPRSATVLADWPTLPSGKTDLAALARLLETQT
jgi:long-chain acyl-CoA synthetase